MLRLVMIAAVVLAAPAWATCWNPLGCAPTTYQACIEQASEAKTEPAAKALIAACDRFKVTESICQHDADVYRSELAHPNPKMVELRKKVPTVAGLDDYAALEAVQATDYPDIPLPRLALEMGVQEHPDRGLCQRFHAELYR